MPAMLETLTGFLRDMDAPDEIMQAMAILSMPGADAQARESALTAYVAGVRSSLATRGIHAHRGHGSVREAWLAIGRSVLDPRWDAL